MSTAAHLGSTHVHQVRRGHATALRKSALSEADHIVDYLIGRLFVEAGIGENIRYNCFPYAGISPPSVNGTPSQTGTVACSGHANPRL